MGKVVLEISHEEIMKMEAILMDNDAEEALRFFKEVLKPKIRARRFPSCSFCPSRTDVSH
jgi:hypothetical protein